MPKKRNHKITPNIDYINTRSSRTITSAASPSSSKTVNERLAQLRAEQAPRPTLEKRNEIATVATAHSMPPNLRQLLDLPETAPPPPRTRARRVQLNGRRAPPGPATPQSWLASSLHAPALVRAQTRAKTKIDDVEERRRCGLNGFNRLAKLDGLHPLPRSNSLVDHALKAMARNWEEVSIYEQYNLSALPVSLKEALMSYLGLYGPDEGISIDDLKILFLTEHESPGGTGSEEVTRIDLTQLLGHDLSLSDFTRYLSKKVEANADVDYLIEGLSVKRSNRDSNEVTSNGSPPKSPSTRRDTKHDSLLDSWEDDVNLYAPSIPIGLGGSRFPNLTRLSLAHAGHYASWRQLLSLSVHLSTLTHLSLAYWPVPTTTPNSKTAFITHNHASISLGGTHIYSVLDQDWHEAANILRRFSNNTYCLKWLDLEGCNEWLPALIWTGEDAGPDRWVDRTFARLGHQQAAQLPADDSSDQFTRSEARGPSWNGSWAQITYMNISQGVVPCDVAAVRAYPAGVIAAELLLWLRDETRDVSKIFEADAQQNIHIPTWLQREKQARTIAETVRGLRKSVGGSFCVFDHGWTPPVAGSAIGRSRAGD